jgi:hypothetical protein
MAVVVMPLTGAGSRVFHPRWSEHHRPTATASMDAECIITRQTSGTTGPDGTFTPGAATPIYTGVCRIVPVTRPGRVAVVGEAQETHRHFQVAVRYDVPAILIDDLIDVTVAVDPLLVGKKLRVLEVSYGSEQWQRNLLCDEREA